MTTPSTREPSMVLIVDDDADIRDAMMLVLGGSGYHVVTAANGADALRVLAESHRRPCVILLDLMMPVMDGQQFREAQLRDPALASIPVVVVSGDANVKKRAAELGVDGYLMKPIALERLLSELGRFCSGELNCREGNQAD